MYEGSSPETGEDEYCLEHWKASQLHQAVVSSEVDTVKKLLKNGEEANMILHGVTPLHLACEIGDDHVVEVLLEHRCDINAKSLSVDVNSPLHVACCAGHDALVPLLVSGGAEVDQEAHGITPLRLACQNGHLDTVRRLLAEGANVNKPLKAGLSPLAVAALNGHTQIAQELIAAHSDLNSTDFAGCTPLYHAVKNAHYGVCKVLLEADANPNLATNAGDFPINIAALYGNSNIVELLIRHKCDVDPVWSDCVSRGESPICSAIQRQHLQVVRKLVNAGAVLDSPSATEDIYRLSPLLEVLRIPGVNPELLCALIQGGCDVDRPCCLFNMKPLEYAILNRQRTAVELLLKADCQSKISQRWLSSLKSDCPDIVVVVEAASCIVRTLKAICRANIRHYLDYGRSYRQKVINLEIPTTVQEFLLFQDIND